MSDEPKVTVKDEVWSEPGETGGRQLLAAPGDVLPADRAADLGVDVAAHEVTHVAAPRSIWSEPGPTGGSTQLYAEGEMVPVDEAERLGIDVAKAKKDGPVLTAAATEPAETTSVDGPAETTAVEGPAKRQPRSTRRKAKDDDADGDAGGGEG